MHTLKINDGKGEGSNDVSCKMYDDTYNRREKRIRHFPSPPPRTVLYCTVLYCTVLYCIVPLLRTPSLQDEDKASDTMQTQHYDTSDHIRSSRW